MLFTVKGYKCFRDEVKIDINKVNLFWSPMGVRKSSILESLSIFIDILKGDFRLEKDEREIYKISRSSLTHFRGIRIRDLKRKFFSI